MFRIECESRSATACGISPQGKGREGIRNGMERNASALLLLVESEKSDSKAKFPTREVSDLDLEASA